MEYLDKLNLLDSATCEACAVSQAAANKYVESNIGYATKVFSQICNSSISLMKSLPHTRWISADFFTWNFSSYAPHIRMILEGCIIFHYLTKDGSTEEKEARILLMHAYDCAKRMKFFLECDNPQEAAFFELEMQNRRRKLLSNKYFSGMMGTLKSGEVKKYLQGEYMLLDSRDSLLTEMGHSPKFFNAMYILLSQHLHIYTMAFYRMEANGRGTGIINESDVGYVTRFINLAAEFIASATNKLCEFFPDATLARNGIYSKFSPGPTQNRRFENYFLEGNREFNADKEHERSIICKLISNIDMA